MSGEAEKLAILRTKVRLYGNAQLFTWLNGSVVIWEYLNLHPEHETQVTCNELYFANGKEWTLGFGAALGGETGPVWIEGDHRIRGL